MSPAAGLLADDSPGVGHLPSWFNDPGNWTGPTGLLPRIAEHLEYTAVIVVLAVLIALPLGLFIGHTGRGVVAVVGLASALRAVPTLGTVVLLSAVLSPHVVNHSGILGLIDVGALANFLAMLITLVLLALPPILTNTYAGVQNVDPAARDAARGMGMTRWQLLGRVEFPCALPLIISGIRSAVLQVIATVTVAAYVPFLGGLGRFIADGAGNINDPRYGYPAMLAAGLVVAVLAIAVDGLLALLQRYLVSPGLSGRRTAGRRTRSPGVTTAAAAEVAAAR